MTDTPDTTMVDDAADVGPLYRQVLDSATRLLEPGRPVGMDVIARHAWDRLTPQQRADSIPELLVCFVTRVQYESLQQEYAKVAAGPDTTTYLGDHDMTILWDALAESRDDQETITVDRQALLNTLCELELLRHRLDMARSESPQN